MASAQCSTIETTPRLRHDPGATGDDSCLPRIFCDCAECGRRTVFCHITLTTLRAYLAARSWRCDGCRS